MTSSSSFFSCCITCFLMIFVTYVCVGHSKADSEGRTKFPDLGPATSENNLKSDFEANFADRRLTIEELARQAKELWEKKKRDEAIRIHNLMFNATRIRVSNSGNKFPEFPKKKVISGTVGSVLLIIFCCCFRICYFSSRKKRNKTTINMIEVNEQPPVPNVIITPVPTYMQAPAATPVYMQVPAVSQNYTQAPVAPPSYLQAQAVPPAYVQMQYI